MGWKLIKENAAQLGGQIDAVGGLTMGADPVAVSIALAALSDEPPALLQAFVVRKSVKAHGRQKLIEGNFRKGNLVVVIDDVITTGGSTLQAIDAIQGAAAGWRLCSCWWIEKKADGRRSKSTAIKSWPFSPERISSGLIRARDPISGLFETVTGDLNRAKTEIAPPRVRMTSQATTA